MTGGRPTNAMLVERDLRVLWHPCSQMKDYEALPPIPIRRGEGAWLEDFQGRRYLDAISSWWVNLFGHANPTINAALRAQLDELEHVILAGFTHEPVVKLSEALVAATPPGLSRCFYADNGSSAIEVAIKMSYHYWRNRGLEGKTRFTSQQSGGGGLACARRPPEDHGRQSASRKHARNWPLCAEQMALAHHVA